VLAHSWQHDSKDILLQLSVYTQP